MGARILIVEDEEPLALLLRYNLEAEGYEVETVARGDEADIRLREAPPDLAVLDWMLPGISGIELCRRLRARPESKALPIIMLTARGEESERGRCCAGRAPSASPTFSRMARSSSIARRSASRAPAAPSISARPNIACSSF
jgi:CheY-like chemotaxis protein